MLLTFNDHAPTVLEGFGFGGALLAMFMRVGGGIFTKAADVGADLVGKVEAGIPEDDPRNAATIADNVGDNVGDCAGMAADLFESYAVTLVAALILGQAAFGAKGLLLPLIIGAIGIISSVVGVLATKLRATDRNGLVADQPRLRHLRSRLARARRDPCRSPTCPASSASSPASPPTPLSSTGNPKVIAFVAVLIGIVLAVLIQQLTGYFTDTVRRPVKDVAKTSLTGPATVILAGISLGLESAVYTAVLIALAVFGAFLLGSGSVGVALFAVALAGYRPAHHRRRHRRHGHLRPGQRQRAGRCRDERRHRRGRRARAHRPRRRRQHHEGDHQGHRDRDRRPRRDRAVRLVHRLDRDRAEQVPRDRPASTSRSSRRTSWSA